MTPLNQASSVGPSPDLGCKCLREQATFLGVAPKVHLPTGADCDFLHAPPGGLPLWHQSTLLRYLPLPDNLFLRRKVMASLSGCTHALSLLLSLFASWCLHWTPCPWGSLEVRESRVALSALVLAVMCGFCSEVTRVHAALHAQQTSPAHCYQMEFPYAVFLDLKFRTKVYYWLALKSSLCHLFLPAKFGFTSEPNLVDDIWAPLFLQSIPLPQVHHCRFSYLCCLPSLSNTL